jgi:hypothetical protein
MSWDNLLSWMTHTSEGGWSGFKDAVERVLPPEGDVGDAARNLRLHFSEFGDADFFLDGSRRWRVRPLVLASLAAKPGEAILSGGRTAAMLARMAAAAEARSCRVAIEEFQDGPRVLRLYGSPGSIAGAASAAGVRYAPDPAGETCAAITSVSDLLRRSIPETAPPNWTVRSFDLSSLTMVDGVRKNAACEYAPRHGAPRWYLGTRQGLMPLPKREALYAAAMVQRRRLLEYSRATLELSYPLRVPMPDLCMRAACLCAGARPRVSQGRAVFSGVPARIAAMLFAATGQPLPAP